MRDISVEDLVSYARLGQQLVQRFKEQHEAELSEEDKGILTDAIICYEGAEEFAIMVDPDGELP